MSLVAHTSAQGTSSGVTSSGIDTSGANLVVLAVSYYAPSGALTITDSKGNTWTALTASLTNGGGAKGGKRFYYCLNGTVGSGHTFTVSGSASFASVQVLAFSGVDSYESENGAHDSAPSFPFSIQAGSVTPTANGGLIVTSANFNSDGSLSGESINSSFTITDTANIIGGTSYGGVSAYLIQGTAGAVNPTWSWADSGTTLNAAASVVIAAFKAATGGTTHTSTGALTASAATVAGTANRFAVHPSTGALTASAATVAGTANRFAVHPSTGVLTASAATVAGAANRFAVHPSTGDLTADAATVAGTAARTAIHTSTGALTASAATVAGAADHTTPGGTHTSTGALTASAATVAGAAARIGVHVATGVLVASAAAVAGTAAVVRTHDATGALVAGSATVSGEASGSGLDTKYIGGARPNVRVKSIERKRPEPLPPLVTNMPDAPAPESFTGLDLELVLGAPDPKAESAALEASAPATTPAPATSAPAASAASAPAAAPAGLTRADVVEVVASALAALPAPADVSPAVDGLAGRFEVALSALQIEIEGLRADLAADRKARELAARNAARARELADKLLKDD